MSNQHGVKSGKGNDQCSHGHVTGRDYELRACGTVTPLVRIQDSRFLKSRTSHLSIKAVKMSKGF